MHVLSEIPETLMLIFFNKALMNGTRMYTGTIAIVTSASQIADLCDVAKQTRAFCLV